MSNEKSNLTSESDEVLVLAQGFCDGTLSGTDSTRLEQLLLGNPRMQRVFLAHVDLHARLCWEAGHGVPVAPQFANLAAPVVTPTGFGWPLPTALGVLLLLLVAVVSWKYELVPRPGPSDSDKLVTVIHSAGLSNDQVDLLSPGKGLRPGILEVPHGIVELGFLTGVRLLVESPARLELVDNSHAFLHEGRLVARVPHSAIGFSVESARARIVDLGTEFGVSVAPEGATLVQVYEGAVDAELKVSDDHQKEKDRLTSGEALVLDESVQPSTFVAHRFVRSFPIEPKHNEPLRLSNRSQLEAVRVKRSGAPPMIDGDLSEWPAGASFVSRCDEPNGDRYFIEGRCLYDDARFYFAAHVGDPLPMNSTVDPVQEPDFFWTGGSIVLRVAVGSATSWPLQAQRPPRRSGEVIAEDVSDQIVHIGMWYSQPIQQPRLILHYGMDCHGQVLSSDGWQGAFRKDRDGHGYTLEYAIDLRLLHVNRPPRAGDVWPANVNVHWSDREGRTCMGLLSEITNLGNQPHNTFRGPTWGKLVFED